MSATCHRCGTPQHLTATNQEHAMNQLTLWTLLAAAAALAAAVLVAERRNRRNRRQAMAQLDTPDTDAAAALADAQQRLTAARADWDLLDLDALRRRLRAATRAGRLAGYQVRHADGTTTNYPPSDVAVVFNTPEVTR